MKEVLSTNYGVRILFGIIVFIILIILLIIGLVRAKSKKFSKKIIVLVFIGFFIISFYSILMFPFDKLVSFTSVEDAYKFQFPEGKFLYEKTYKNTVFVSGTEVYDYEEDSGSPNFTYYVREDEKWRSGENSEKTLFNRRTLSGNDGSYYLYKLYNKKDNVTGIFVHGIFPKDQFDETCQISDSKQTEFEIFKGFGDVWEGKDTYIAFGIVEGEIPDNYYISIDHEKFYEDDWELF